MIKTLNILKSHHVNPITPTLIYTSSRPLHLKPTIFELERNILNPAHAETCLSGIEDQVASHKSSYDPTITSPENEFQILDKECKAEGIVDPLLYSPANLAVSLMLDPMIEEKLERIQAMRKVGSAKGWTRKGKEVHIKHVPGGPFDRYEKLIAELKKRKVNFPTSTPGPTM